MSYQIAVDVRMYLDDRALALADTSRKSRESQLLSLAKILDLASPRALWLELESRGLKPYSRATVWSWVTSFWDYRIEIGRVAAPNQFAMFRRKNAKQFRNVYEPKIPELSFDEVLSRLDWLEHDTAAQAHAVKLLTGGLRYAESFTYDGEQVVGKGGKRRKVYPTELKGFPEFTMSYRTFLRRLSAVGLKPHTLRKVFATKMANDGLGEADLCKLMGWSSFRTASAYVGARKDAELGERVRASTKQTA